MPTTSRPRRFLRKHSLALAGLGLYLVVLFFPTLFMGRLLSPNDVFSNYDPWAKVHAPRTVQNSLLNDPPTSYYTLVAMLRRGGGQFHWNPWIASGIPGFGSSASAELTPFVLATLVAPQTWFYTIFVLLKIIVAFVFTYLWLREERLGRRGAALGALVVAGCGIAAVRWLWQISNATALYPALLWVVRRGFSGRRVPFWAIAAIALSYALAGFPAAMAYGAWIVVAYAIYLAVRTRTIPRAFVLRGAAATLLAVAVAAPSLVPFVQLIRRSGYLDLRRTGIAIPYPLHHFAAFIHPERLGNPALHDWKGDPWLGAINNNFLEACIYLGIAALVMLPFGLANRRAKARWFWAAAAAVILACAFDLQHAGSVLGRLPGFRYSSPTRPMLLLPLADGYLAAAGLAVVARLVRRIHVRAPRVVALAVIVAASWDLSVFAARFQPYLPFGDAGVPSSPTIQYLRSQPGRFRIAPFFDYLWPNSAELFELEDIRSHFGSEARYRRLLQRVDPSCWAGRSTVLTFNSLKFNLRDPIVDMLGTRFFVEHRAIDIVKWSIFKETEPALPQTGTMTLRAGMTAQRSVPTGGGPFFAIDLPAGVERVKAAQPRLLVRVLHADGRVVSQRAFTPADVDVMNKLYLPLYPSVSTGETVRLVVTAIGLDASLPTAAAPPGESPIFYNRVKTPVIFDRELRDGRLFVNLAALPRFWAVQTTRPMSFDEMLGDRSIDFAREAALTGGDAAVPAASAAADVRIEESGADRHRIATSSTAPFLLASSEKLTPELAVSVDGRRTRAVEINGLFAGVVVPAGRHEVVYAREIGRGWWPVAAVALALLFIGSIVDVVAVRVR